MSLRSKAAKLALDNLGLRPHLVPLLQRHAASPIERWHTATVNKLEKMLAGVTLDDAVDAWNELERFKSAVESEMGSLSFYDGKTEQQDEVKEELQEALNTLADETQDAMDEIEELWDLEDEGRDNQDKIEGLVSDIERRVNDLDKMGREIKRAFR